MGAWRANNQYGYDIHSTTLLKVRLTEIRGIRILTAPLSLLEDRADMLGLYRPMLQTPT